MKDVLVMNESWKLIIYSKIGKITLFDVQGSWLTYYVFVLAL